MEVIIFIAILILSVVAHEIAHGYAANYLGDPTARLQGRLNPNPIKHLDPFGSVILPTLLVLLNSGVLFGWAKPVPYNPYNLRGGRYGEAFVASAGVLTNLGIAIIIGLSIRFFDFNPVMDQILYQAVYINVFLALFNLLPIPPLDGSKIVSTLILKPHHIDYLKDKFSFIAYNPFAMIFVVFALAFLFIDEIVYSVILISKFIAG